MEIDARNGAPAAEPALEIEGECLSDVGLVRQKNEDSCGAYPQWRLFVVADGMGGANGGQYASATAVESLELRFAAEKDPKSTPTTMLQSAVEEANRAIFEFASKNPPLLGMGTTLVAVWFPTPTQMFAVSVGDSRIYRLRDGTLRPLTRDHSVVAEMVASGEISEAEARAHPRRHVLTRALGIEPTIPVEVSSFEVSAGDVYLLCSDGLHDAVDPEQLQEILVRHALAPSVACRALVGAANANGGKDNATAVVVRCSESRATEPATAPAAAPMILAPGTFIAERYEIVNVIGIGGMGVVYKVLEHVGAAKRFRALKTIRPEHVDASAIVRFRHEAERMCVLEHENIVPLVDYSDEGEMPYLVTPFIEGQTLGDYLSEHMARTGSGLPLEEVLDIGIELVRALECAHGFVDPDSQRPQPIIHRDIKPGNVMIKIERSYGHERRRVLVMDFGIAKAISENSRERSLTQVVGTIKYAPPEQLRRSKDVDARTDIYSLGMLLYELYCGHQMLRDFSEQAVLMRAMRSEVEALSPSFPEGTPESFQTLIGRCVAADRDDRPASVREVGECMAQILSSRAKGPG